MALRHLLLIILFIPLTILAQKGTIRGTVIEDETGEPLYGVTAIIKGTSNGSITDFDGKFEIKADAGSYDIQISFVSFATITITDVEVQTGEVNVIDQIRLKENVQELGEVIVTAEVIKTSETALLTVKRKSPSFIDGISSAKFSKIGDGNASDAVKRVTGVSVEGGKYVYVRGLGDRYTKTTLNSMEIPGLDPDRNSLQIDIFPTSLIDNMIILKTATADMPADFTGGVVNIDTKDFPDEKIFDISLGVGYNPAMHFNADFLDYEGGALDFLGIDDGTRALPDGASTDIALAGRGGIPTPVSGLPSQEVNDFVSGFNPNLGTSPQTSLMDFDLGLTYGNQIKLKNNNKLGYIFSGSYKNERRHFDRVIYGEYQRVRDQSEVNDLLPAQILEGSQSNRNILLAGLAGLAYKTEKSKYRFTVMHLQNAESRAGQFDIFDNDLAVGKSGYEANSYNIEYNQRSITNVLLNGRHVNPESGWEIDWRLSPTLSSINDPDIRKTAYTFLVNDTIFTGGAAGFPSRIWRFLTEVNVAGKFDVLKNYTFNDADAKLRFGFSHTYKNRDYEILSYDLLSFVNTSIVGVSSDPQEILTPDNIYPNGLELYYQSGNPLENPNEFQSNSNTTGLYVSNEFNPLTGLRMILGLRAENFVLRHTGRNSANTISLDDSVVLNSFDLFPSANFIYSFGMDEKHSIRSAYSRTVARPSFKEMSFAGIIDPITNRTFNGGLAQIDNWDGNLRETYINNVDLRYEYFMEGNQLISLSAFYKAFRDPIEIILLPQGGTNVNVQPRNVGNGLVYGLEFELRKSLNFISESMRNWAVSSNLTFVNSQITMTDLEFDLRFASAFLKDGEQPSRTRQMAGQAPYIINAGLSYDDNDNGFDAGLYYNVKGPTLTIVAFGVNPDVYSEPFHSLNFSLNKSFGEERRTSVSFQVSNILNDDLEQFFTGYGGEQEYFEFFSPGTTISLGLNYSF